MKRGRKPLAIPRKLFRFYCREDLIAEVELLLADPMRERAKYGARTEYLESLIEADLRLRRVALTTDPAHGTMSDVGSSSEPDQE